MLSERDVAEILGDICDGIDVPHLEQEAAIAALRGKLLTSDAGERLYYLDLNTILLDNVDTAECIWSVAADGLLRTANGGVLVDFADENAVFQEGFLVLNVICEPTSMRHWQEKWMEDLDPQRPMAWQKALKRVVEPLLNWPNCHSFRR